MFPAGDCTVLRLCPKQYGWYSVVLEIDPLFPRYSLLSGGGGLVVKSCPTLVSPWTVACQAPLSVGFSRQEYWSGLPGDLPNPGIEPVSLTSPTLASRLFTTSDGL